ncbi:9517_t:CDS:2 [Scutellospora calospora]|uniref:9517_t:CDS:1 n=1 Tax=Scutellospora calospora TaxID=85575 RepID=A0ACA9KX09_9GLOM|nr:9517_t:CDS:2 [Scutellospora calospora]
MPNSNFLDSNCNEYVTYMTIPGSENGPYVGKFLPNYNVTSDTGDSQIHLTIMITNSSFTVTNEVSFMVMYAFDKENDNFDPYSETIVNTTNTFDLSLLDKNLYYLSQPKNDLNVYVWSFTRNIRYVLIPDILSYFGRQIYVSHPYLESTIEIVPLATANTSVNPFAELQFYSDLRSITREETEQSAITAFYIFLFGLGLISPWGIVQKSNLFKNQYKKKLLPFSMDSQLELEIKEYENDSLLKRLDNLEKRAERLEKSNQFYKECIIDTSILNSFEIDTFTNNNSSSSLMQNNNGNNSNK